MEHSLAQALAVAGVVVDLAGLVGVKVVIQFKVQALDANQVLLLWPYSILF